MLANYINSVLSYDVPGTEYVSLPTKFRFNVGPALQRIAGSMPVNRLRRWPKTNISPKIQVQVYLRRVFLSQPSPMLTNIHSILAYDVPGTDYVGLPTKFRFNVGPALQPISV